MTIRAYRPGDETALYDVCLRTGADGDDASALYRDPRLLGEVYVGPYLRFAPELALVAEDEEGVGGYALGAADTPAFETACEESWWPALRRRYPLEEPARAPADAQIVRLIHHPPTASPELAGKYPAHLHIDLLPRLQGKGYGRCLMNTLFDKLTDAGADGVHLRVSRRNTNAIGFYQRIGMEEHSRTDGALIMTLALPDNDERRPAGAGR